MNRLTMQDLHWAVHRLPSKVVALMQEHPTELFLAGGFLRACVANEPVADIDLFVPQESIAELIAYKLEGVRRFKTRNALTVHLKDHQTPIQIIHRWTYKTAQELAESFDFTVAKSVVWYDGTTWQSLTHESFYADLAAKRLVYTSPQRNEDAGGSVLRVLKFYQKGYRIPLDSLGAVLARLTQGVSLREPPETGPEREAALAKLFTGLLHEVDPVQDPQHIFHLPSELPPNPN